MHGNKKEYKNYHPILQQCLNKIFSHFRERGARYVVLRDAELLPSQSGFDVDLICQPSDFSNLLKIIREIEVVLPVVVLSSNEKKRIVIFYCSADETYRNSAILDFQFEIKIGNNAASSAEICEKAELLDNGVMQPSKAWQHFLRVVQSVKKNETLSPSQEKLHSILKTKQGASLFKRFIKDISALSAEPSSPKWLSDFALQTDIKPYAIPKAIRESSFESIKQRILGKLFFIHRKRIAFIVISGPDGVGKTTLLNNINAIFRGFPILIDSFHHTTLVKSSTDMSKTPHHLKIENLSFLRTMRRKFTPPIVKSIYSAIVSELSYATKINTRVNDNFQQGKLTFSDRYIYDRTIKMGMAKGKSKLSKHLTKLSTSLMRRPEITIIPIDKPSNILRRKKELTLIQIEQYYQQLNLFFPEKQNNCLRIIIKDSSPEQLAISVSNQILSLLGEQVFKYIGKYESHMKNQ